VVAIDARARAEAVLVVGESQVMLLPFAPQQNQVLEVLLKMTSAQSRSSRTTCQQGSF